MSSDNSHVKFLSLDFFFALINGLGYFQSQTCSYWRPSVLYLLAWHYHLWTEVIHLALPLLSGPRLVLGGFDLICSVSLLLLQSSTMHKYFRNQNDLWHGNYSSRSAMRTPLLSLKGNTTRDKGWGKRREEEKEIIKYILIFVLESPLECVSLRIPSLTPFVCLLTVVRTFALISFRSVYWRDPRIMSETEPHCIL